MDPLDPVAALHRCGGVSDGAALRGLCDPWQLRVAVREGRVIHLGRNSYALPGAGDALAAATQLHGVVSHLSAAISWGWKVKHSPARPFVTVPRGRKVGADRRDGLDVHFADLAPDAVKGRVTSRAQTVVDCARALPFDEALSVADSALREAVVTRDQLIAAAQASPRTGHARAVRVTRAADDRAANPFESCLRAIALDVPGLSVQPQLHVPRIGHADLGDRRLRLLVEADSHEFHAERDAFRYDIRRYTAMVRDGWTVLRFCWEDVMSRPAEVYAVLADVVARLSPGGLPVGRCPACPAA